MPTIQDPELLAKWDSLRVRADAPTVQEPLHELYEQVVLVTARLNGTAQFLKDQWKRDKVEGWAKIMREDLASTERYIRIIEEKNKDEQHGKTGEEN